jgi:hypothetical protein
MPLSPKRPLKGYRYSGAGTADDPCTSVVIKENVVRATCRGQGVTLEPPFVGNVSVALTVGSDDQTFCCSFGGTEVKNEMSLLKRKVATAPQECEPGTTTTSTIEESTTSTTLAEETTTTTLAGETTTTTMECDTPTTTTTMQCDTPTTTTVPTGESTTTTVPTGETTTTTLGGGETTTTTVMTGETTTTTIGGGGGCCNGAGFLSFSTVDQPGDCGDIQTGTGSTNLSCSGLYTGGGGNSVPLPLSIPDLGQAVSAITACTG